MPLGNFALMKKYVKVQILKKYLHTEFQSLLPFPQNQSLNEFNGRHSSVVLSASTILWQQVQIPSTPSTLFSICIIEIVIRKGRKETKRGRDWPILKKSILREKDEIK